MKRILRALALVLFVIAALFAPFVLLPIRVRWPSRRDDAIVELAVLERAPPAVQLRVAE